MSRMTRDQKIRMAKDRYWEDEKDAIMAEGQIAWESQVWDYWLQLGTCRENTP